MMKEMDRMTKQKEMKEMKKFTREELKQLKSLRAEVESLALQIVQIRPEYVTDYVKDYRSGYGRTITISGISTEKERKLRRKLELKQEELQEQIYELENFLDTIPNSEIRQILRLRYGNGLTWNDIARKLCYADESVPRKRHDRFLNDR